MVVIGFVDEDGDDLDGLFQIHMDSRKYPNAIVVEESSGLDGNVIGQANQILYHEQFGGTVGPNSYKQMLTEKLERVKARAADDIEKIENQIREIQ
jgi:hypothetical protein